MLAIFVRLKIVTVQLNIGKHVYNTYINIKQKSESYDLYYIM